LPIPFSPVQRALKFSDVFGTTSAAKVILRAINYKIIIKIIIIISDDNDINNRYQVSYSILPTEMLPISISKKTLGFSDSMGGTPIRAAQQ